MNHRIYLIDVEQPLRHLMGVLADHCEEGKMHSKQDLLMLSLNLLCTPYALKEAVEALLIDIDNYCAYTFDPDARIIDHRSPYTKEVIRQAVEYYLKSMQNLFEHYRFYDNQGMLQYTFGGWQDEFVPMFVPYTHIHSYPQAISAVIAGEPPGRHPGQVFYPFPPDTPDPYLPF